MTTLYLYTPAVWPPLAAAIFLVALSLYSWRRRRVPGALQLVANGLFGILVLLGLAFEAAAIAPATKIAWYKFQVAWELPFATTATCFILEYTYPGRWLTRRNLSLLALPPLLVLLLIISDAQRLWGWVEIAPHGAVVPHLTMVGVILVAYGLGLILINMAALLWLFICSPQHRWPAALMLFGPIAGRGLFLLDLAPRPWVTPVDPLVVAILLPWTTYAIALFGFRIFDPLPAARETALAQMQEGMVVFDARWQVASLNPAAATILSTSAAHARGKTLAQILPAFPDLSARLADAPAMASPIEVSLGAEPGIRLYALSLSVLKDFRGPLLGYLLLFRDVTEQRRAQAQILEQRTAVAALAERERMARELHDGLGQVLGYVKMQAQAARSLLAQERKAEADSCLGQLASVTQDLHADVRDYIFEASAASPIELGFGVSLQEYLRRFGQMHQIRTELEMPPEMTDGCFEPTVAVQLLRIIQEALANARKHAHASRVQISLAARGGMAEVTIADDGQGFDPSQLESDGFGLRFMRERADGVGGTLQVRSTPGQGTQVVVEVPLRKDGSP